MRYPIPLRHSHLFDSTDSGLLFEVQSAFEGHMKSARNRSMVAGKSKAITPAFSYKSGGDGAVLEVDLPGVKKEDISLELKGEKLTVTGKRSRTSFEAKQEPEQKRTKLDKQTSHHVTGESAPHSNRGEQDIETNVQGKADKGEGVKEAASNDEIAYKRVFRLHGAVDTEKILAARYNNGVLTLTMPYREQVPRRIDVARTGLTETR